MKDYGAGRAAGTDNSRSVRAVGVGAAVRGVLAALPSHSVPHLHSDAGLGAPPDGTPKLLGPTVCELQVAAGFFFPHLFSGK